MKRTESTSSAQVLKKTQPEEFDLVILGGGTGSDGTFPILVPEIRERSVCPHIPHCEKLLEYADIGEAGPAARRGSEALKLECVGIGFAEPCRIVHIDVAVEEFAAFLMSLVLR